MMTLTKFSKQCWRVARDTVVSAKSVMNKGYWTGNLARMIRDTKMAI